MVLKIKAYKCLLLKVPLPQCIDNNRLTENQDQKVQEHPLRRDIYQITSSRKIIYLVLVKVAGKCFAFFQNVVTLEKFLLFFLNLVSALNWDYSPCWDHWKRCMNPTLDTILLCIVHRDGVTTSLDQPLLFISDTH